MTLTRWSIISPTSIYSCQRAVVKCSLPSIPRPCRVGFGRTNRTKPIAGDGQSSVFLKECLFVIDCAFENIIRINGSMLAGGVLVRCSFFNIGPVGRP